MKCLLSNWQLELFAVLHLHDPLIFLTAAQKFGICQFLTVCFSCVARIFITTPYIHCQLTRPLKNQILGQNQSWIRSRPKPRGIEPHNCTSLLVGFYSCTFLYIITCFLLFSSACLVWVSHIMQNRFFRPLKWSSYATGQYLPQKPKKVALARLKDYHLLLKCAMQQVADSILLVVHHRHRSSDCTACVHNPFRASLRSWSTCHGFPPPFSIHACHQRTSDTPTTCSLANKQKRPPPPF